MKLNLGCGKDAKAGWTNVDQYNLDGVDEVVNLNDTPWPWVMDSVEVIRAEHVFEHLDSVEAALTESARILKPGGTLTVVMPMGVNAIADPDHERVWTYQTPEFYTGKRHWDSELPLEIDRRDVRMHSLYSGVLDKVHSGVLRAKQRVYGNGEWCFNQPAMSGEFTTVFKHVPETSGSDASE